MRLYHDWDIFICGYLRQYHLWFINTEISPIPPWHLPGKNGIMNVNTL
jgi:hypothetical protein